MSVRRVGDYGARCCGWKASLSCARSNRYHGQEIEILEQDLDRCARLSVDASNSQRVVCRVALDAVEAPAAVGLNRRTAILITSTPTPRAAVHPALRPLGRTAPRYMRRVRQRDRRALTRRGATGLLAFGVLISGPTLALSSGPDASASRSPRGSSAMQQQVPSRPASLPEIIESAAFVAPVSRPLPPTTAIQAPPLDSAGESKFVGAYARRNGTKSWVAYPTGRFHPFLVCTRSFESDTAGGYVAVSPDGRHRGAYQFKRSTWNTVARNVGRDDLIGVDPASASAGDQDWMALYLYKWLGASHWEGRCAGK